jgi:signal transduction histidine kinase
MMMIQRSRTQSEPLRAADDSGTSALDRLLRHSLTGFPFELQARLFEAQSLHEIYEIGVAMLVRIPGTVGVCIFQRGDQGDLKVVHAWQSPFVKETLSGTTELGQAIHQRWIATHRVGQSLRDFARPFRATGFPSWLLMPMLAGDELIGAIATERRDGTSFPYAPEDIVALSAAAAGMAWAIHSVFLRDRTDLQHDPDARADIIAHERREIGRELHDGVVQDLAYVHLKVELVEKYLNENPTIARGELQAARDLLDHAINELRGTIGDLRRRTPARRGITGQLRSLVSTMAPDAPRLDVDFKQISGVQLVPEVERAVVGIVREALQNVRKHSRAQSVKLEVRRAEDELRVYVVDDGVGFSGDPRSSTRESFGLELMRELAEDLGGTLEVVSDSGRGTRIQACLPLVLPVTASVDEGDGLAEAESVPQTDTASDSSQPHMAAGGR